ncbi:hypothetical protein [Shinella sp. JR1-6]|uniref:hypothetical protein n=1 Tax=Shinella sp. JR1-6 TaxID=2527671 RepID=UPI00102D61C1|nr:hypothetical protein [Shinella sp. JR1-6]TAA51011.1 hypothetical protein EXZ48_32190 [Shinella sp. JR1-6]
MTPEQQKAMALAKARQRMAAERGSQAQQGMILPISKDASGNVSFDSDAGLLGALKRTFMLPGEVMKGEVDPMSPEGIERAMEFATTVTPASAAMKGGERIIPGVKKALEKGKVKPPTSEELKAAAQEGYETARGMNVDYSAKAVQDLANDVQMNLEGDGVFAELAPKTFSLLKRLGNPPEGAVASISNLEAARRAFGNAAKDFSNPTEQMAAKRVVERLDRLMLEPDEASVVAGPAAEAGAIQKRARGNYAAAKRSETITGLRKDAELDAIVANSGANADNRTRQRIKALLQSPKKRAGYSDAERAGLREVAEGTKGQNLARTGGNLLGGGGGLGALLTAAVGAGGGAISGSPTLAALGFGLPIAGRGLKMASDAGTAKSLRLVDELIRQRSPLFEEMLKNAPMEAISPEKRAAIVRALLLSGQSGAATE